MEINKKRSEGYAILLAILKYLMKLEPLILQTILIKLYL